jgi:hypothetical protein
METLYASTVCPESLPGVLALLPPRLHRYIKPGRLVQVLRHDGADSLCHTTLVLPEEGLALDSWPVGSTRTKAPTPTYSGPALSISVDSETPEVAAWATEQGLTATVAGQWVWVPDSVLNREQFGGEQELRAVLFAAGFGWSPRRQGFFHACTVAARGTGKRGGKLERKFSLTSAADYRAGFDPRPAWVQQKERKRKRRS